MVVMEVVTMVEEVDQKKLRQVVMSREVLWTRSTVFIGAFFLPLLAASGALANGIVTLETLMLYQTHEKFGRKPEVYWRCQGEDRIDLPDVTERNKAYVFLGQESWQPLTTLVGNKCKRCGLYERDTLKEDDTFEEWELCPLEFSPSPEGRYFRKKDKQFGLDLICTTCNVVETEQDVPSPPVSELKKKVKKHHGLTAVAVIFILICLGSLLFMTYSFWFRKHQEEQAARFVQLFEDDDFFEEELGLKEEL